jgi:hypothetical protein
LSSIKFVQSVTVLTCNHEVSYSTNKYIIIIIIIIIISSSMKFVQSVTVLTCNREVSYSTNTYIIIIIIIHLLILEYSPPFRIMAIRHNSNIVGCMTRILIPLNPLSVSFNIG